MQVFELHFNPKAREEGRCFDSFVYEPENLYERKLGNLYMAGGMENVLPQNSGLLEKIASTIKKEYYLSHQRSPDHSFRESLKKANEFLSGLAKEGNVSWLGNLNLAVLGLKDFVLSFSKVGNVKILLLREEEILDISQNLEFQNVDPYPLKMFSSVAVGNLVPGDRILILTKDVFEAFKQEDLLKELGRISKEKELKSLFKSKEGLLSELSGICLLVILTTESLLETNYPQAVVFREKRGAGGILKFFKGLFKNQKLAAVFFLLFLLLAGFLLFH
jgi:hypothetical protein